jgi:hypothetical protein
MTDTCGNDVTVTYGNSCNKITGESTGNTTGNGPELCKDLSVLHRCSRLHFNFIGVVDDFLNKG